MKSFLKSINYSSCNEDTRSEYQALRINQNDSVLCITGSGSRPLELLIKKPASIVAIDFNPCQNFLLELKMKAFQLLEYEELLKFFGIHQSDNRVKVYLKLRKSLTNETKNYWDKQKSVIKKGLIYQGRWEKYFHTMALIIGIERPKILHRLFHAKNLHEQKKIWTQEWDTAFWKIFLRIISPKIIWRTLFKDPGFFQYVPGKSYIYNYIYDSFDSAKDQFLFKNSPFATLLFYGKYTSENVLPIYLKQKNFETIRKHLNRIQIVTASLSSYLENTKNQKFTKLSLSDFNSYLSDTQYLNNWQLILNKAKKNAIICERQWLVKRDLPKSIQKQIISFNDIENALALSDDSIFYTFHTVRKI